MKTNLYVDDPLQSRCIVFLNLAYGMKVDVSYNYLLSANMGFWNREKGVK